MLATTFYLFTSICIRLHKTLKSYMERLHQNFFKTWLPLYAEKILHLTRREGKLTSSLDGLTPSDTILYCTADYANVNFSRCFILLLNGQIPDMPFYVLIPIKLSSYRLFGGTGPGPATYTASTNHIQSWPKGIPAYH